MRLGSEENARYNTEFLSTILSLPNVHETMFTVFKKEFHDTLIHGTSLSFRLWRMCETNTFKFGQNELV